MYVATREYFRGETVSGIGLYVGATILNADTNEVFVITGDDGSYRYQIARK